MHAKHERLEGGKYISIYFIIKIGTQKVKEYGKCSKRMEAKILKLLEK